MVADPACCRLNIIYRDLKPENILLDAEGADEGDGIAIIRREVARHRFADGYRWQAM